MNNVAAGVSVKSSPKMTRLKEFGPWSEQTSSSGKRYYYNRDTEVSQWEKPSDWKEHERAMLEKYKSARPSASSTNESTSSRSQPQTSSSRPNNSGSTANGNSRPSSSTTYHGVASTASNAAIKTNSPLNSLKRDQLNNNDAQKSSSNASRTSNSHVRPSSSSQYGNNNSSTPMFSSPLTVNSFTNSSKAQDTLKSSTPYVSRVNLTQNANRPFLLSTTSASTSSFTVMPTSMTSSSAAIGGYHSHHRHSNSAVSTMDSSNGSNGMAKMDHYQNQPQSSSHQQHHQHSSASSTKASPLFVTNLTSSSSLPSTNGHGGGGRSTMIPTSSASSSSAYQISSASTRKDSSSLQQINRSHEQDASQHGPVFREDRYLKHYRADLTAHRRNWPSDSYALEAKRYAEKNQRQTLSMNALDDDIKSLYSLMNAADVRCSLLGQKLTFVRQQIQELESKNPSI